MLRESNPVSVTALVHPIKMPSIFVAFQGSWQTTPLLALIMMLFISVAELLPALPFCVNEMAVLVTLLNKLPIT